MREILFPAHRLLHQSRGGSSAQSVFTRPLTVPSATYDALRATLVQAEQILLRVLGFELMIPQPLDFLPRYLERAMEDVADAGEDYDAWGTEEKEEFGVVKDTALGKACKAKAVLA